MISRPATHYAQTPAGDHVAFQVHGSSSGHRDLLFLGDWLTNLDIDWEYGPAARFLDDLGNLARVIRMDARGTGLSDPVSPRAVPTTEELVEDIVAVLNAAESSRPVVVGTGEGGLLAMVLAAIHPERVSALMLVNTFAKFARSDDYPHGHSPVVIEEALARATAEWGTGISGELWNPSHADDPAYREWFARWQRTAASPAIAKAVFDLLYLKLDVRAALPAVQAPTRIVHRRDNAMVPVEHGRYLAEAIPGAGLVELTGADSYAWAGDDAVAGEIEEFVTGSRSAPAPDRILATVLFTDIVGSTDQLVSVGDRRWRSTLDAIESDVVNVVRRFGGRVVKSTGDGMLATFDGPARAVRCAKELGHSAKALGIDIRAGLHTGEIEVRGDDVAGVAVHLAARVAAQAGPGEVLVSRTVKDLSAGSELVYAERGMFTLKGIPDDWELFSVQAR